MELVRTAQLAVLTAASGKWRQETDARAHTGWDDLKHTGTPYSCPPTAAGRAAAACASLHQLTTRQQPGYHGIHQMTFTIHRASP